MSNTIIHTPIDTEIDAQVKLVFSGLGLSVNDAITLFLNNIVENKTMPFSINIPNKETLAAIEEARHGNLPSYTSLEAMWEELDNY
jgi:DNA-damage-inducible protein J